MRLSLAPLMVLALSTSCTRPPAPDTAPGAAERLRADLEVLAGDALEGRGTPSRGLDTAALYLETQLRLAGVQPGLPDGFRQWYRIGEYTPKDAKVAVKLDGRAVSPADSVLINFGRDPALGPIAVDLVDAGFGVVLTEKKVDELAGLDVRRKGVVAKKGAAWKPDPQAVFGADRAMGKLLAAAARGAQVLVYSTPELLDGAEAETAFFNQMKDVTVGFVREPGLGPAGLGTGQPASALNPVLLIRPAALGASPKRLEIRIDAPVRDGRASNVIGRIQGTDLALRDQWVVLTAHYDHLGSHDVPPGQDGIWNGADDNASGTTVVVELARRFAARPGRRSILVLLTSGEDRGVLGSAFYSLHPVVPMDRVVANVNVDMVGRSSGQVQAIADGTPQLFEQAVEAGRRHGLQVIPDQQPSWRVSYLIDSYHFLRFNVPAVFFFTGVHPDYHQPSDTAAKIRYNELARILELATDVTRWYAEGAPKPEFRRPEWFLTP